MPSDKKRTENSKFYFFPQKSFIAFNEWEPCLMYGNNVGSLLTLFAVWEPFLVCGTVFEKWELCLMYGNLV